ncbi:MAG: universal stress protein [Ktedonobacteraceae bacterium]|nr:universal stress protein [Ktedonobacteraceae bacterium]
MFKRILVPLDGSGLAERALPVAARLARASGGSITLVRVISTTPASFPSAPARPNLVQSISETDRRLAASYLEGVAATDILRGIYVKNEVSVGLVAPIILSIAASSLADIIVMGSHGFTGVTRWMMGSVADKVARYADVPVLILRDGGPIPTEQFHHEPEGPRILVPLDGSQNAEAVLAPAASLATALSVSGKGALHFIHVASDEASNTVNMAKKYIDTIIQDKDAVPREADLNLTLTSSIVIDKDVAHAIVRTAEQGSEQEDHFDAIAMSTHGYGGLQRWVTGSVTGRVLNTTRLPVLVVRPTELS